MKKSRDKKEQLLTPEERELILGSWNATAGDYPADKTLYELFEEETGRRGEAVALRFAEREVSYRELDELANKVARAVRARYEKVTGRELTPDTIVGLCADRSVEMVAGILGIQKAGGAYLPLDPEYPEERLRYMLEDSGVKVVLTEGGWKWKHGFLGEGGREVLSLDREAGEIGKYPGESLGRIAGPEDLAYVIYTSGSTGRPKGVLLEHRGAVNRIDWMQKAFGLEKGERVLQKTPYSFDVSVWEFFWPLLVGSELCVAQPGGHRDPVYLIEAIERWGITTMHFVPSMLRAFLSTVESLPGSRERLRSLRRVICSGEGLPTGLSEECREVVEGAGLYNLYGPTEATVDVSWWDCGREEHRECPVVPIGVPIANIRLYVLNSDLDPVPVGVPGELYISGVGLARGYLGKAELTAERFVANPYAGEGEEEYSRMYRTGDLARWLSDGAIEYLGRTDFQVKVRGFRVELGEIESVLLSHEEVKEGAVTARTEGGEQSLVGYWVGEGVTAGELRDYLGERLPGYMVPSILVKVKEMPLTSSGKIDRKALPPPRFTDFIPDELYVPPRTATEKSLAGIWSKLLRIPRVGIRDNFFLIGGHSLAATRVISRIREDFQVDCPLTVFFEKPEIALLADFIDSRAGSAAGSEPIPPADRTKPLPLSFAQQRLWFLYQYEEENRASYNIPMAFRLQGRLDIPALEKSLEYLICRHQILRTAFTAERGDPSQVILPPFPVRLPPEPVDLRELYQGMISEEKMEELSRNYNPFRLLKAFLTAEAHCPFDLEKGPVFRANLYRLVENDHTLILNHHHIVTDAWSVGILLDEFAAAYRAYQAGREPDLPELPLQYADFAAWQRSQLRGESFRKQVEYWREKLINLTPLELPTDRPRPKVKTYRGRIFRFALDRELTRSIGELAARTDSTLFMILLAAVNVLLYRYSDQEDIVVGIPIANRTRQDLEGLIGFFVNTLPLRSDLSGGPSFLDLIERARRTCLEAYDHQDVPFEHLVEILQVERDSSRTPIFQVALTLQNATDRRDRPGNVRVFNDSISLDLPELKVEEAPFEYDIAKFDLTFSFDETERGLSGEIEYNTDLYDRRTVARMSGHLRTLLRGIIRNPENSIADLPLLTEPEKRRILEDWNRTESEFPRDTTLVQWFEKKSEEFPDLTAVVCGEDRLSYRDLNRRANLLAHTLRERYACLRKAPLPPGTPVGLCAERGVEMVAGIIGIVKSGAAYIPLDPEYPEDRLRFILDDLAVDLLLVQDNILKERPFLSEGREVILLETPPLLPDDALTANPPATSRPDDLAYIIYTSGTTGRPKGIGCTHRNVVNFMDHVLKHFPLPPGLGCSLGVSFCFDVSVYEIWTALLSGGCLHVMLKKDICDPDRLFNYFSRQGIGSGYVPPFFVNDLDSYTGERGGDWKIERFLFGVEPIDEKLLSQIRERYPESRIINGYGPTETTICCSLYEVPPGSPSRRTPIGKPYQNVRLYVLNESLRPVPVGVPGQLFVAGEGVSRGYLNRPELNREKFIPNPFATEVEKAAGRYDRLYRTGDLVYWLPDGNLVFVGRRDFQVKIRGFRIELEEIEEKLRQYPGIDECVLAARQVEGQNLLVAYFVPDKGTGEVPKPENLREYLLASLPEYMVPGIFISLEELPLSAGGKINRKALPTPSPDELVIKEDYVLPETPEEKNLVSLWEEVLGLERVGIRDNFFSLGGHSLTATRVASRIEQEFEIEFPLKVFFQNPDIQHQALYLSGCLSRRGVELERILPADRAGRLPLSFAQERLWFLDRYEDSQNIAYHVPLAYRLRGKLDRKALEGALNLLVERHESLRTVFKEEDGLPRQEILPSLSLHLEPVTLDPSSLRETLAREAIQPFDLEQGPLFRVSLYRLGPEDHILFFNFHHIISDGWSVGILLAELNQLYRSAVSHQPLSLPRLPLQYADFAVWQRQWLRGDVLQRQLDYWRERLEGFTPLDLPADRLRPAEKSLSGRRFEFVLDSRLGNSLRALARDRKATLFMVLLSALDVLLSRYSGRKDIVVGTPVANRNHPDVEPITGFFVNTLALRGDLSGNPSFSELLERNRPVALEAYQHQDLPFEYLVEDLGVKRDPARTPIFQVLLVLRNADETVNLDLCELECDPLSFNYDIAKFDLTFSFVDTGDGLRGEIEYNTDLYRGETIRRMAGHLRVLLEGLVSDPDEPVASMGMLLPEEEERILGPWSGSDASFPGGSTLADLFERQAEKTPDRIAVSGESGALTYRELDRAADLLARQIGERYRNLTGSPPLPDTMIGLCLDRGPGLIVGLLGILKAGAAYIPLDPAYPEERLKFMLEDAGLRLVVSEASVSERLPFLSGSGREVVPLESGDEGTPADQPRPSRTTGPGNLAYVIYTSGSTGQPKGVMVEHRGVVNLITEKTKQCRIGSESRVAQFVSISFDVAVSEIFTALLTGATLFIVPEDCRRDFVGLADFLAANRITVATIPSAVLSGLPRRELPDLQTLVTGGSVGKPETLDYWSRGRRLINEYGPTETTVCATWCEYREGDPPERIGRPVPNARIYVLDENRQPVPAGFPGELYIGGAGLARGYLNQEDLTRSVFVKNPFAGPGEAVEDGRLYRTGDLVRWDPEGSLRFVGRTDFQLKIRGFRVEPLEIESRIISHPAVDRAAVVAREWGGELRLLGYYLPVAGREEAGAPEKIREYLRKELPDHMVPAFLIPLESFPLTANGKVDRDALPEPDRSTLETGEGYTAPRNEEEETLVSIWQEILGLERVGVHDNFFSLGGHSLLVTRVISRVNRDFGVHLPVKVLFSLPTVAELSQGVRAAGWMAAGAAEEEGEEIEEGEI